MSKRNDNQDVLLSVRNASKVYRMGDVDVHALRDATLDIYDGEFLVIIGPSGSGKSTLLNLIGGMDSPTSGSVFYLDKELTRASEKELTLYRRNEVGFIFQLFNLIPSLTALENVQVAVEIVADSMDPVEALRLVGLEDRAGHFPAQLSGGEQQRVAIARGLAGKPRMLLCDEPTGALDSETAMQTLQLLHDLNKRLRKTIVVISHHTPLSRMADRIAIIRDGRIVSLEQNASPISPEEISW